MTMENDNVDTTADSTISKLPEPFDSPCGRPGGRVYVLEIASNELSSNKDELHKALQVILTKSDAVPKECFRIELAESLIPLREDKRHFKDMLFSIARGIISAARDMGCAHYGELELEIIRFHVVLRCKVCLWN